MNDAIDYEKLPWYRQFWLLFIIALPLSVIIACIFLIILSFKKADDVITSDYYRKGLDINTVLEQMHTAENLGLSLTANIDGRKITATLSGDYHSTGNLLLELSETTDKNRDTDIILVYQGDGSYVGELPDTIRQGRFYMDLSPMDNTSWLIKSVAFLPADTITLKP